jgi:NADH dehydrogenase
MTHLVATGLDALPGPTVVVLGGGFAGITLIQKLAKQPVKVLLIDQNNFHTFQPLLYQVATGSLAPDNIGFPYRRKIAKIPNVAFRKAVVQSVDTQEQHIHTDQGIFAYDYLVVATGSKTNFFGNEALERNSLQLKSIAQALDIRSDFLQEFEDALYLQDDDRRSALNFVIVGGGPTGVEVAGALAEIRKNILAEEYKEVDAETMQITLIEAGPRVLASFSEKSSHVAQDYLRSMGVQLRLGQRVLDYDGEMLTLSTGESLRSRTVIWSAGVMGAAVSGLPANVYTRANRLSVNDFLQVDGVSNVFAVGDVAFVGANGHPMVAPVAIQQAEVLAKNLLLLASNAAPAHPFRYRDQGNLATIGRNKAVVEVGKLRFQGLVAWYLWMAVHLVSLIGFKNRLVVLFNWAMKYFSHKNIIRLIVRPPSHSAARSGKASK